MLPPPSQEWHGMGGMESGRRSRSSGRCRRSSLRSTRRTSREMAGARARPEMVVDGAKEMEVVDGAKEIGGKGRTRETMVGRVEQPQAQRH